MSVKCSAWAWRQDVSGTSLLVLLALADAADDDGYCYPSIEYLAYKATCSTRSIMRAIEELEELELLAAEKNYRTESGMRLTNVYFLNVSSFDHQKRAWSGPVSSAKRKDQMERLKEESKARRARWNAKKSTEKAREVGGDNLSPSEAVVPSLGKNSHVSGGDNLSSVERLTVDGALVPLVSGGDNLSTSSPIDVESEGARVTICRDFDDNLSNASYKETNDDLSHHQSGREVPASPAAVGGLPERTDDDSPIHQGIVLASLADRLMPVLGHVPPARLRAIIDEALSKAKMVSNPLAFVAKCVENDPPRFAVRQRSGAAAGLTGRSGGGGGLVPGESGCPVPDHGQYLASNCPACKVAARIVSEVAPPAVMSVEDVTAWREKRRIMAAERTRAGSSRSRANRLRQGL